SAFSAAFSFTTGCPLPAAPVLSTPANGTTGVANSPTLTWAAVTGATSYSVQVATDSGFTTIVSSGSPAGTSFTVSPPLNESTTYFWRVASTSACGTGSFSAAFSFTTLCTLPGVPVLSSPADGSTGVSTSPTLNWNAVSGA